jgi:hypothetical protein
MTVTALAQEKPKNDAPKSEAKPAATAAAPTIAVDDILNKFVQGVGGKEAVEKLKSRTTKGTFEIEAMSIVGPFENYEKAPNKNAIIISIPNMGTFNTVFDGAKGWDSNPMTGLRELSGAELAALKRDADFYSMLNFKQNYAKLEAKGKDKVGASEVYVVEATPAEGGPEKFYFDTNTGLLLRQDSERETPQGKLAVEQYFEDYKVVDGIKIAHTLKQVTPMYSLTIKLSEIKHNAEIDDAKFNKPSGD